ncbi:hypothetical protein WR25_15721 isoform B [Diploscapter pachys]|uniref:PDZ domain-containing protein n=1 Tax=Diploscapter pachys TaxID=2018661 RepID=A0A2A2J3R7_9BILA|nr:hypothetical protein WR25_15721 isoform B [Diploscapter pachys]
MVVHVPDDAPSPRLCVIEKRPGEKEYGYNLHAEKARGQFVGLVDNGSPADRGGLKQGDRIFAVNGQSIVGENHKKVVERIKQNPNRCEMLVISEEGAKWYAEHGISITHDLPNITHHNPDDHTSNPQFVAPPPPPIEPMHGAHDKPMPRICRLIKSSPSDEFGFNLHAERGRGHFIGTVDTGGIGDRAGLRMGQRIVGVNDTLVYPTTPHKEVVALIKRSSLQTTLLVASEDVDKWYKDHNAEYSFAYAEEYGRERTGTYNQGLTPHSIHISDDDEVIISPQHSSIGRHTTEPPEIEYHEHGHLHYSYNNVGGMSNGSTSRESREGYGDTGRDARESYGRSHEVYGGNSTDRRSGRDDMGSLERGHHRFAPPISDTPLHGPPHPIDTSTPIAKYLPSQISPESAPSLNLNQQASPLSNGSVNMSGYSRSSGSPTENDIYNLSAKDAREFLRSKNRKNRNRGIDMSLDEKYQVVTNM